MSVVVRSLVNHCKKRSKRESRLIKIGGYRLAGDWFLVVRKQRVSVVIGNR